MGAGGPVSARVMGMMLLIMFGGSYIMYPERSQSTLWQVICAFFVISGLYLIVWDIRHKPEQEAHE